MQIKRAYSFDDVLLVPNKSEILPRDAQISSFVTNKIKVSLPFISAAMDKVTESKMAIAMALSGAIGVIHKNMTASDQAMQVRMVKDYNAEFLATSSINENGKLRCGAAIGTGDEVFSRADLLIDAGVDLLVVDTAHGHSKGVIETVKTLRNKFAHLQIVAGNIATADAAKALIEAGVDAVKVGIGPGSICTTRIVAGVGVPQLTAINDVANFCKSYGVKVIADGGIKYSGDIAKAIAAGADIVMIGSLFAGCDESPGEVISKNGSKYKEYRGMGSLGAMSLGSAERYFQDSKDEAKLVPEGVEGQVAYKGSLSNVLLQLVGGLRAAMGYTGNANIEQMKNSCSFVEISAAGIRESHPHSLENIKEAPNYK
jgi:IMP dehydrogenase